MKKTGSIIKKIAVVVFIATVLLTGLVACQSKQTNKAEKTEKTEENNKADDAKVVKIGSSGTDGTATDAALIAQKLGYFEEELKKAGYTPEYTGFTGAGPAMNEAMASGSLDIALYGDLPAITAKSSGVDVKIFASYNSNYPFAVLVSNKSGITSVKELKGKKVAVGFGTVPYEYLSKLLEKNGLSINDVQIVNTSTDGPTMMASDQVDAVVTADTTVRIYEQKGIGKTLVSSKDDESISGLLIAATTSKYINENREAVKAVIKALNRAYEYAKENPDKTLENMVTDNYTKELLALTYSDTSFSYYNPEITDDVKTRIESTKKFLLDNKLISTDINTDELFDNSIYKEAVGK